MGTRPGHACTQGKGCIYWLVYVIPIAVFLTQQQEYGATTSVLWPNTVVDVMMETLVLQALRVSVCVHVHGDIDSLACIFMTAAAVNGDLPHRHQTFVAALDN